PARRVGRAGLLGHVVRFDLPVAEAASPAPPDVLAGSDRGGLASAQRAGGDEGPRREESERQGSTRCLRSTAVISQSIGRPTARCYSSSRKPEPPAQRWAGASPGKPVMRGFNDHFNVL